MKEHNVNNLDNFIGGWYSDDTKLCDEIIEYMKNSPNTFDGKIGGFPNNRGLILDPFQKISKELLLNENPDMLFKYQEQLRLAVNEYIEKYPYCNMYNAFTDREETKIQYYPPYGGFFSWHTERGTDEKPICTRHLVFMTYLNDVNEAGETEFYHQQIKVKPEKGLTLIWPADWTFTHRGIPSPHEKYIVTGWLNFDSQL